MQDSAFFFFFEISSETLYCAYVGLNLNAACNQLTWEDPQVGSMSSSAELGTRVSAGRTE